MSADCRCYDGYAGIVQPWIALSSLENWGDDAMTPNGVPDGDTFDARIPFEDRIPCDIFGTPYWSYDSEDEKNGSAIEEALDRARGEGGF